MPSFLILCFVLCMLGIVGGCSVLKVLTTSLIGYRDVLIAMLVVLRWNKATVKESRRVRCWYSEQIRNR
jgi:hypothetical protein